MSDFIGKYSVIRELGAGGFGAVYQCRDPDLGRDVAVKVFRPRDANVAGAATSASGDAGKILEERFLDEARILHDLGNHPNIVSIREFSRLEDGAPYYVMSFLPKSLVDEMGKDAMNPAAIADLAPELRPRRLPLMRVIDVITQVASALGAVHQRGLVHRDIKPANILFTEANELQLVDFGIAKLPEAEHSQTGIGMGSRDYMSPEQRESAKHVDARSDIYSLGVLAYRMLTGQLPVGRYVDPIDMVPEAGKPLSDLIVSALSQNPSERPADGAAFAKALKAALGATDTDAALDEATEFTGTFVSGPGAQTRSELTPLIERIEALLLEHGEVPADKTGALKAMAAVADLDAAGLSRLIDETTERLSAKIKPISNFLKYVDRLVDAHQGQLSSQEIANLFEAGQSIGWDETRVRGVLTDRGAISAQQEGHKDGPWSPGDEDADDTDRQGRAQNTREESPSASDFPVSPEEELELFKEALPAMKSWLMIGAVEGLVIGMVALVSTNFLIGAAAPEETIGFLEGAIGVAVFGIAWSLLVPTDRKITAGSAWLIGGNPLFVADVIYYYFFDDLDKIFGDGFFGTFAFVYLFGLLVVFVCRVFFNKLRASQTIWPWSLPAYPLGENFPASEAKKSAKKGDEKKTEKQIFKRRLIFVLVALSSPVWAPVLIGVLMGVFKGITADNNAAPPPIERVEGKSGSLESNRDVVLQVQQSLKTLGYDVGTPDGVMGPRTATAIRAFQTSVGLPVTGTTSNALIEDLNKASQNKATASSSTRSTSQNEANMSPVALNNLGIKYSKGDGVPKDEAEAVRLYRLAAEQGNATAQINLAVMYAEGRGVPKDVAEAVKWYRLAAEQGDATAQLRLATGYRFGKGIVQDDVEAVRWYRLAAEQGNPSAQSELGFMYDQGRGVAQDYAEALRLKRLATEQGYAGGQSGLAHMYRFGKGVQKDEAEAVRLNRLAAEQGYMPALSALGYAYASGRGVTQNNVVSYMLYSLAISRGSQIDAVKIDEISKLMTPNDIAKAQEMARTCKANNYKNCGF